MTLQSYKSDGSRKVSSQGALLYTSEMEAGAADESIYPTNRELSCAGCSTIHGPVYTQYGSKTCSGGATKLYDGFLAVSYYSHNGGGANHLCMHPQPQWPSGYSNGSQDGNLLYGVEYENTGST